MSGENGTKYVTLLGDKKAHILAGDRTSCGLYVPAYDGAEWGYTPTGDVCSACTKAEDKFAAQVEEPAPFEEGVPMVETPPPSIDEPKAEKNQPAAKAKKK